MYNLLKIIGIQYTQIERIFNFIPRASVHQLPHASSRVDERGVVEYWGLELKICS